MHLAELVDHCGRKHERIEVGDVTVAWGRDYTDVPPLKGVIFTESDTQELEVTVDVVPVAEDDPDLVVVAR